MFKQFIIRFALVVAFMALICGVLFVPRIISGYTAKENQEERQKSILGDAIESRKFDIVYEAIILLDDANTGLDQRLEKDGARRQIEEKYQPIAFRLRLADRGKHLLMEPHLNILNDIRTAYQTTLLFEADWKALGRRAEIASPERWVINEQVEAYFGAFENQLKRAENLKFADLHPSEVLSRGIAFDSAHKKH